MDDLFPVEPAKLADLLQKAGKGDLPGAAWPESLLAMASLCARRFQKEGLDTDMAGRLARLVVVEISAYLGGRPLYLPKGDGLEAACDHAEAWAMYTRTPGAYTPERVKEIAQRFKWADGYAYAVLRDQHALWTERVQPRLFQA